MAAYPPDLVPSPADGLKSGLFTTSSPMIAASSPAPVAAQTM